MQSMYGTLTSTVLARGHEFLGPRPPRRRSIWREKRHPALFRGRIEKSIDPNCSQRLVTRHPVSLAETSAFRHRMKRGPARWNSSATRPSLAIRPSSPSGEQQTERGRQRHLSEPVPEENHPYRIRSCASNCGSTFALTVRLSSCSRRPASS